MSKPCAEEVAEKHIRRAGYRVYLPRYRKVLRGYSTDALGRRVRNGQSETVTRPLFPGYLFVELHPGQMWRPMRTIGVMDSETFAIMRGERPALLDPELVEAIRESEQRGEFDDPALTKRERRGRKSFLAGEMDLKPCQPVRVEVGPFTSYIGQLADMDESGRVKALLSVMGRQTAVWLPIEDVSALEAVA